MPAKPMLRGIFPPLTTPFDSRDSVDLNHLAQNIARYNRTALAGYVLNGSTGESVLLAWNEVERIWAAAREAATPGKVLIAGTGAESTAETIEHTNRAAALGYEAALVRTPHYYKPQMTEEAQAEHFLRVADAARIPILLYSVPIFTGLALEASLLTRVAHHPNILGIKDSSGDVARAAQMARAAGPEFSVLVGSASTFYASLRAGACGAILAVACAWPELCLELQQASQAGDAGRAESLQQLLQGPSELVSRFGIPGLKYALDRLGYYGGPARRPLLALGDTAKQEIDAILASVAAASSAPA